VSIVSTGKQYVLLSDKGESKLHHLRHFFLFTSQNVFLVQLGSWRAKMCNEVGVSVHRCHHCNA
jgi:hypothetical protein